MGNTRAAQRYLPFSPDSVFWVDGIVQDSNGLAGWSHGWRVLVLGVQLGHQSRHFSFLVLFLLPLELLESLMMGGAHDQAWTARIQDPENRWMNTTSTKYWCKFWVSRCLSLVTVVHRHRMATTVLFSNHSGHHDVRLPQYQVTSCACEMIGSATGSFRVMLAGAHNFRAWIRIV